MSEGIVGTRIAHFAVVAKLGAGGMGVVYRAKDEKLGRDVALKLLPPAFAADVDRRARFMREARSAAAITHPNIATVHEVGEVDGRIYIAMELVEGQSLAETIAAGALPMDRALSIARGIARGVAKAHERGIVHRDLKPDNVMIDGEGHVKVLDFGLAKMRDDDAVPAGALEIASTVLPQTEAGAVVGTPGYMSPEQVLGRPVDPRSDVFSFGVLLYEITTGARPFVGRTSMEVAIKIERDPPRAPSAVNPNVDVALEAVILRCLEKKPSARYANARELLAAIDAIAPSGSSARSDAIAKTPNARSRRAIVALLIGGVAITAIGWRMSRPSIDAPSVVASTSASASAASSAPVVLTLNTKALEAYDAGLASRRLATGEVDVDMRRAIALDPDFAAAHLRLIGALGCVGDLRKSYRAALANAAKLTERDRDLLDAYEPVCQHEPPDVAEYKRRLLALAERHPTDADLWFDVAGVSSDPLAAIDRAIALDPGFANAYARRGGILASRGEIKDGILAYEKCLAISNGALKCQGELVTYVAASGDCARLEVEARRAIAMGTDQQHIYVMLASALLAQGQPVAAAREALRQGSEKRAINRDIDDANIYIEILTGDFTHALAMLADRARADDASPREADHVFSTEMTALVSEETGDGATARRVASAYFAKQSGWEPSHGADATADLLGALGRLGDVRAADAFTRIDKRLRPSGSALRANAWLAYTPFVFDAESASLVLKALDGVPLPPEALFSGGDQSIGKTFAFGGRTNDATHWLEKATRACQVIGFPLKSTWAHFGLAEQREKAGDKIGACASYRVVVDRWGHAKPKSVTADKARARTNALACAPH